MMRKTSMQVTEGCKVALSLAVDILFFLQCILDGTAFCFPAILPYIRNPATTLVKITLLWLPL